MAKGKSFCRDKDKILGGVREKKQNGQVCSEYKMHLITRIYILGGIKNILLKNKYLENIKYI